MFIIILWRNYLQCCLTEHCQTLMMEHFTKRMSKCRHTTRIVQCREGFVELGHVDKYFVKNKKKVPPGKHFFLLDTLKITFWMENLTQRWTRLGYFFQNQGFFSILGKGHCTFIPSCMPVSVAIYTSISRVSLNIFENMPE